MGPTGNDKDPSQTTYYDIFMSVCLYLHVQWGQQELTDLHPKQPIYDESYATMSVCTYCRMP